METSVFDVYKGTAQHSLYDWEAKCRRQEVGGCILMGT
jgi:hypothetical protein